MGVQGENIAYYPSNTTILIAVGAEMGFALLPSEMLFGLCPEGVSKIPLDLPEARISRSLAWNKNSRNTAALRFAELAGRVLAREAMSGESDL